MALVVEEHRVALAARLNPAKGAFVVAILSAAKRSAGVRLQRVWRHGDCHVTSAIDHGFADFGRFSLIASGLSCPVAVGAVGIVHGAIGGDNQCRRQAESQIGRVRPCADEGFPDQHARRAFGQEGGIDVVRSYGRQRHTAAHRLAAGIAGHAGLGTGGVFCGLIAGRQACCRDGRHRGCGQN